MELVIFPIISCVAILITIGIYLSIWRRHNIHGWNQFAFLISAFLYFIILFIRKLNAKNNGLSGKSLTIESLYTYFTIGHCTNLVNLNFHMFSTFLSNSNGEPGESSIRELNDLKGLFISLLICWTFPLLLTILEAISDEPTKILLERGVIIVLIVLNSVIVTMTVIVILRLLKQSNRVTSSNNLLDLRSLISLFIRLFLLTGMIWTIKTIPILLLRNDFDDPMTPNNGTIYRIFQFLTETYGIIIFGVFVINKKILDALKSQFPKAKDRIIYICSFHNKRKPSEDINLINSISID